MASGVPVAIEGEEAGAVHRAVGGFEAAVHEAWSDRREQGSLGRNVRLDATVQRPASAKTAAAGASSAAGARPSRARPNRSRRSARDGAPRVAIAEQPAERRRGRSGSTRIRPATRRGPLADAEGICAERDRERPHRKRRARPGELKPAHVGLAKTVPRLPTTFDLPGSSHGPGRPYPSRPLPRSELDGWMRLPAEAMTIRLKRRSQAEPTAPSPPGWSAAGRVRRASSHLLRPLGRNCCCAAGRRPRASPSASARAPSARFGSAPHPRRGRGHGRRALLLLEQALLTERVPGPGIGGVEGLALDLRRAVTRSRRKSSRNQPSRMIVLPSATDYQGREGSRPSPSASSGTSAKNRGMFWHPLMFTALLGSVPART